MDRRKLLGLMAVVGLAAVPGIARADEDHGREGGRDAHDGESGLEGSGKENDFGLDEFGQGAQFRLRQLDQSSSRGRLPAGKCPAGGLGV